MGKVLETGCLGGRTSFELARHFDEVVGVEASARLIQVGHRCALEYMTKCYCSHEFRMCIIAYCLNQSLASQIGVRVGEEREKYNDVRSVASDTYAIRPRIQHSEMHLI